MESSEVGRFSMVSDFVIDESRHSLRESQFVPQQITCLNQKDKDLLHEHHKHLIAVEQIASQISAQIEEY